MSIVDRFHTITRKLAAGRHQDVDLHAFVNELKVLEFYANQASAAVAATVDNFDDLYEWEYQPTARDIDDLLKPLDNFAMDSKRLRDREDAPS